MGIVTIRSRVPNLNRLEEIVEAASEMRMISAACVATAVRYTWDKYNHLRYTGLFAFSKFRNAVVTPLP